MHQTLSRNLLCFSLLCGTTFAQDTLNLESNYSNVKNTLENGGNANVAMIGDSLTFRQGAFYDGFVRAASFKYNFSGKGWQPFSRWTGAGVNPGWTEAAINTDIAPYSSLNGMWLGYSSGSTSAYISSQEENVNLYYETGPGYGNALLTYRGGYQLINCNSPTYGVSNINIHTQNFPVWVYPSNNGSLKFYGVDNIGDATGLKIHKIANGGYGINNFNNRDYSFDSILENLNVDLYIIMLGQNDGGMNEQSYTTALTTLHNRLKSINSNCKIIFVSNYDSGNNANQDHANAMRNVAYATGDGFFDLYTLGGNYAFYVNHQYLDTDGLHFSENGGNYVGSLVFNTLESYGNDVLICDNIDFNKDEYFPDSADIDDFLSVFSGGPCSTNNCGDIDFNNDGLFPDLSDIDSFITVFSGGPCK